MADITKDTNIIFQSPQPKIIIKDPNTNNIIYDFSAVKAQSYNFSLSNNDVEGSFNLILFPEVINDKEKYFFENIPIQAIVEIYEDNAEQVDIEHSPVFVGIVNRKKYVLQAGEQGATRRLTISGTSIMGLIKQFYLNMDATCLAVTQNYSNAGEATKLTIDLLELQKDGKTKIKDVVLKIWQRFVELSSQFGTPKIAQYIENNIGTQESIFEVDDDIILNYPLGCVFNGESTQDFFSLIDGLIPQPIYEKTAYMGDNGKMRLRIRMSPFDSDKWQELSKERKHTIYPIQIKSIEIEQSDKEVYTVFFSYLQNSPVEQDKSLKLYASMQNGEKKLNADVIPNEDKFKTYGYRPLICNFLGYTQPTKDTQENDKDTGHLTFENEKLKNWYSRLDEMLQGSVTLAMTYGKKNIMPGDKIAMLGGEFYVEGISHSWNYGSAGEINISFSRGGDYSSGQFKQLKDFTTKYAIYKGFREV